MRDAPTIPALLNADDVAKRLQISVWQVRTLAASGALGAYRIGKLWRFDEEQVETYLASVRQLASGRRVPMRQGGGKRW